MSKNRKCETCKHFFTDRLFTGCLNIETPDLRSYVGPENTCELHEFENELDYLVKPG